MNLIQPIRVHETLPTFDKQMYVIRKIYMCQIILEVVKRFPLYMYVMICFVRMFALLSMKNAYSPHPPPSSFFIILTVLAKIILGFVHSDKPCKIPLYEEALP